MDVVAGGEAGRRRQMSQHPVNESLAKRLRHGAGVAINLFFDAVVAAINRHPQPPLPGFLQTANECGVMDVVHLAVHSEDQQFGDAQLLFFHMQPVDNQHTGVGVGVFRAVCGSGQGD